MNTINSNDNHGTTKTSEYFYALSTSVGSGKTRAAIGYMTGGSLCNQNFIYVAPTIRLVNQTADNLRRAIEQSTGSLARNLHLIHSESRHEDDMPTSAETLKVINEAIGNVGQVVIVTTKTFLTILADIENKEAWRVILDEAFSPIEFLQFYLGSRPQEGWSYFQEVFTIDPNQNQRIIPVEDCEWKVQEIATGNLKRSGQRYKGLQPLATAVANPALCNELVMTKKTKAMVDDLFGASLQGSPLVETGEESESVLLIASYVTPEHFRDFKEVLFMAALFDKTMLYYLWSRVFGIRFKQHPAFPEERLRNIHKDQGKYVAIGHLLHPDDSSSKINLSRNAFTGVPDEKEPGQRVIDHLVNTAAEFFKGGSFLLQVNSGYGYDSGSTSLPVNAVKIPTLSHGLNDYQDCNFVAALAVTNPVPQQAFWIKERTGLTLAETLMAYRIHTTYQAVGRTSIRKREQTTERKVFLTVGHQDAKMLHQLFPGSQWLGQVGDMKSLVKLSKEGKEGGLIVETAKRILEYLDGLSPDTRSISSRALKAKLAPGCKPSTWAKATRLANQDSSLWTMDRSSFVRRDYEYFFGEGTEAAIV